MNLVYFFTTVFSFFPIEFQRIIYNQFVIGETVMKFQVQPNSVWLGYQIKNSSSIETLIPDNLELSKISMFGEKPQFYLFFNFFNVSSDYFSGLRMEIVTTAREKLTCKNRFVILDYLSNTISSDPNVPFKRPNKNKMYLYDIQNYLLLLAGDDYVLFLEKIPKQKKLLQKAIIDPNKFIYYRNNNIPNELFFNTKEVSDTYDFNIIYSRNQLWEHARSTTPDIVFYYPNKTTFFITPGYLPNCVDNIFDY